MDLLIDMVLIIICTILGIKIERKGLKKTVEEIKERIPKRDKTEVDSSSSQS